MHIIERWAHRSNYSTVANDPKFIVLHETIGTLEGTLAWFENPLSGVSSHYVVGRNGAVYQCVREQYRANHAGNSECMGFTNLNAWSIGIEIEDPTGDVPYTSIQFDSLIKLCVELVKRYHIPLNMVVGHVHVAMPRGRKSDPKGMPWWDVLLAIGQRVSSPSVLD